MRRAFTAFLMFAAAFAFAGSRAFVKRCWAAQPVGAGSKTFTVEIEAEAGKLTAPMEIVGDTSASGGRCIRSSIQDQGSATFSFRVPADDDYVVWTRMFSEPGKGGLLWVSMDGAKEDCFDLDSVLQAEWREVLVRGRDNGKGLSRVNPRIYSLRAGDHQVEFRVGTPGLLLDSIAISGDRGFTMARRAGRMPSSASRAERPSQKHWWDDQVNVVTWGQIAEETDPHWAAFAEATGATIMDRAFRFPRPLEVDPQIHQACQEMAKVIHARGWKLNSFRTIMNWDPSPEPLAQAIESLKKHIDDGCDGVHLDWFNNPKVTAGAPAATRQIREELRRYGREKYARDVMFAGNIWRIERPVALELAPQMDVVWMETFGDSDLDVVRVARVAAAAGYGRPVWYHLQPDDDKEARIKNLANLPRALFSSCLMEEAVFLCNYKYPIKVKGQWRFFYINPAWEQNVLRYSKFARRYRDYYIGAQPQAAVLVAFQPPYSSSATSTMQTLLGQGVNFNVLIHGGEVFPAAQPTDTQGYAAVIAPGWGPLPPAGRAKCFDSAETFLRDVPPEVGAFLTIEDSPRVLGRVMTKGKYRILHLKQTGYTDKADSLPPIGPFKVTMLAPGVTKGFVVSPDRSEETPLRLDTLDGGRVAFTVPGIEYCALVVLE
jgi:hypothetical protein